MINILFEKTRFKYLNRWLILIGDVFISVFTSLFSVISVTLLFRQYLPLRESVIVAVSSIICSLLSFYILNIYKGIIRHSAYTETGRIAVASIFKILLLYPVLSLLTQNWSASLLLIIVIVDMLITFFLLSAIRTIVIYFYHYIVGNVISSKGNVLIYINTQDYGKYLNSSLSNEIGQFHLKGFISTENENPYRIGGYSIYIARTQEEFDRRVNGLLIKAILFTREQDVQRERDRLVRFCEKRKIKMLIFPEINEIGDSQKRMRILPEVRVEDLLSREEIKINMAEIEAALKDKIVMVTGAAGSIGSEICRQLCRFGIKHLVLFDNGETPMHHIRLELEEKYQGISISPVMGDVRTQIRVERIVERYKPQIIFHAAAYKHVPLMEENPCEAVRTNLYGTRVVADAAIKYGVEKFVMISTDKAVNPTNVMGASKRLAEIYVHSLNQALNKGEIEGNTRFVTTRFGNVLGSNGSVIPRFREQIAKGGPVTVTHKDIIRYFMTIPEACRLVMEAGVMGKGGEIFIFDMGEPVKIVDLAYRMIELTGLEVGVDIEVKFTGLRPGEKLYEELLSDEENTLPTPHPKIRVAKVRKHSYSKIEPQIQDLTETAFRTEIEGTICQMKKIVPEFVSMNSVFEKFDKTEVGNISE